MAEQEKAPARGNRLNDTTAVRGGTTPGILRYMLFWSLLLVVVAMAGVWFFVRG
ncbi:hypothetical protein [Roseomonas fluvialis]|uniref:Uncharacterized protein n=1 Tax=Roseomonas fluvialis TaxID=1750527 RepID=A0ABM7Y577_9PROT|nr:hypothetical protein [Roseomonas fluvialis]BDG73044.1 hypothetical protein Rmf_29730 [Roseomonas fluvialis]